MARYWRCRRVTAGQVCNELNLGKYRKCHACGKLRPAKRKPAHRAVLDAMPYEVWEARYGASCGICGAVASARRRLDRDHDHKTGLPRGLLCARCNRALPSWVDVNWLMKATTYLLRVGAEATREEAA